MGPEDDVMPAVCDRLVHRLDARSEERRADVLELFVGGRLRESVLGEDLFVVVDGPWPAERVPIGQAIELAVDRSLGGNERIEVCRPRLTAEVHGVLNDV